MRELRKAGLGYGKIAAQLNDEGLPSRSGKRWHGIAVSRILRPDVILRLAMLQVLPVCSVSRTFNG